jgi:hypothetical protein
VIADDDVCVMIMGILDIICCFDFGAFGVCGRETYAIGREVRN